MEPKHGEKGKHGIVSLWQDGGEFIGPDGKHLKMITSSSSIEGNERYCTVCHAWQAIGAGGFIASNFRCFTCKTFWDDEKVTE